MKPGTNSTTLPMDVLEIGPAWSGHPVGFALLTAGSRQFVAYYDEQRRLTVAARDLCDRAWDFLRLPEQLGWDSHNGVALGCDESGHLHLSGNMHADPLVYFRTREAGMIQSLERVPVMVGEQEDLVTYPEFFTGPSGRLCFGYRHGSSGRGDQIYNGYDAEAQRWQRLSSGALVSGEGMRNAYLDGPRRGPDGFFHLCWVWRDDPDCATNHDVCYARSRDLVRWETSCGEPLQLPIIYNTSEVVDPVPVRRGLLNGNTRLGFDGKGRAVISYHKLDEGGSTQIFNARREGAEWRIRQATDWNGAWLPEGWGTIPMEIKVHPVRVDASGRTMQRYWHARYGHGQWLLDGDTLRPREELPPRSARMEALARAGHPGAKVHWAEDRGGFPFVLRWESLPENRDQQRSRENLFVSNLQLIPLNPEDRDFLH